MLFPEKFKNIIRALNPINHIQTPAILLCLAIAMALSACDDNDSPPALSQIIPLQKGNTWIYNDTTIADTGILATTDTVTVLDSRVYHDTTWWNLSAPFNPFIYSQSFAASPSAIFSLQSIPLGELSPPYVSKEYVNASHQGLVTIKSLWEAGIPYQKTVKTLSTPVVTPAGTFYSCYEYTYNLPPDVFKLSSAHVTETVCPGVGMIKITATSDAATVVPPYYTKYTSYTRTLVKYTVKTE